MDIYTKKMLGEIPQSLGYLINILIRQLSYRSCMYVYYTLFYDWLLPVLWLTVGMHTFDSIWSHHCALNIFKNHRQRFKMYKIWKSMVLTASIVLPDTALSVQSWISKCMSNKILFSIVGFIYSTRRINWSVENKI